MSGYNILCMMVILLVFGRFGPQLVLGLQPFVCRIFLPTQKNTLDINLWVLSLLKLDLCSRLSPLMLPLVPKFSPILIRCYPTDLDSLLVRLLCWVLYSRMLEMVQLLSLMLLPCSRQRLLTIGIVVICQMGLMTYKNWSCLLHLLQLFCLKRYKNNYPLFWRKLKRIGSSRLKQRESNIY